ncbi:gliding motility-associated C-terminal domain-containing protein [Olleya sp. ITB9]|uniref:DUF7507 domain-containing protein n=1 Tax=Olleya sp. ITB9 TaxID=1715648 RepID=UPI0016515D92|nr:gliding motility-associated C-terminal domain-containing protein [Olleya sp. ITB9]
MEKIKINFIEQLLFIVILLVGLSVKAQVKKQFTPRYNSTLTGDVTIIANNMLSRTATGNYNGNGDNHTFTNNVYVDIDNDNTTFNSSSANLSNPRPNDPCLQIEKVLLYWAAADRGTDTPNGTQTDNQPNWNYNDVKLMLPGQTSYTTITADDVIYRGRDENPLINNDPYVCVKDITNSVNNLSNPFGKFQVANVEAKTGFLISHENTNTGTSGGWQIIMVYKSENLKTRNITLFDGYANVTSSQNNFNIDVSGFQTVPNGSVKADIVIGALEGDRSLSGDRLQIRNTFNNFVDIDAPQRNTFNFFNSRITVGNNNFTDRNPASLNTLGFDASVFSLSNNGNNILDNNQTSATFRLTSNQETYGLFALGFSVEVYEPIIQTIFTASPINITPGNTPQTVNYSANISNIGNDNANNVSLSTVIPLGSELTLPITGLTSGITYNYDNNSRVLTFIIDNGLLDTSESLDLQYQTTINDQCYYLTNNCSDILESNLVAYYSGELNIKDFVSNSSNDVDECNIGNNLNTIVTVNAPAEATWITNTNDLDRTIECNDTNALNLAQALFPQASCSGLTVIKTSGPFVSSSNCPTIGTYTNTWNFTDSCGRTISNYVQTITIEDTTPPNFDSTLPNDITVTSENIPNVPTVTATDNCGEAVVSFSEIETGNICDGSYTITRTWIATDECNLTVSHTQTITVTQPILSASIVSITDVLCNSEATGSIDISVTGGTAPYSYIWNDTNNTTTQDLNNVIAGAYNVTITDANGCTTTISDTISEPATPLSLNITKIDATSAQGCNDGQATAIVSGGTAGYTYLWSASANNQTTATANNLSEGTHSVTITDANGCQITQSIVILCVNTCDAEINIDTITNVLCTNESTGAATVSASSDANPNATFTFTWSNGQVNAGVTSSTLDNQSAGVYSVSVTIDGTVCQAVEETISITEPSNVLDVTAVTTDESGPATGDGTATATATGGVQPYQYTWSPNGQNTNQITGLSAGNYTVTVTDANGCTDTVTVTVNPGSCNNLSVTGTSTPAVCFGQSNGTINATVTGGSGDFTYAWDTITNTTTSVSNLPAGDYTITVTDKITLCTANTTITINEPNQLSSAIAVSNILCKGEQTGALDLAVNGGNGNYTFLWDDANASTTEDLINVPAGTYTVIITDDKGCTTTDSATILEPDTNVNATIESQTNVDCFNGDNGQVTIVGNGGISPYSYSIDAGSTYQNNGTFSNLTQGNYTITVLDANGCTFDQNVIITQPDAVLSASINSQTNTICGSSNGSATIFVEGGTEPYEYLWNDNLAQNTATATNLEANTYNVTITDANNCSITLPVTITNSCINIVKTGVYNDENQDNCSNTNETITYTFTVTNTGNTPLENIIISDPLFENSNPNTTITLVSGDINSNNILEQDETWVYSANYPINQTQIDSGQVENQATVSATNTDNITVSDISGTTVDTDNTTVITLCTSSGINVVKTAAIANGDTCLAVDSQVTYTFTVTNTGSVSIDTITINDTLLGGDITADVTLTGDTNNDNILQPTETWTYTAPDYTVTQADVDAGTITNTVTVNGNDVLDNTNITDNDTYIIDHDNTEVSFCDPTIGINIVKTGVFNNDNANECSEIDETISYTFTITNTGSISLQNVIISDPLLENATPNVTITYVSGDLDNNGHLAPTETWVYTATYLITQLDIDATEVINTATVSAEDLLNGNNVSDTDQITTELIEDITAPNAIDCEVLDETIECEGSNNETLAETWNNSNLSALENCVTDSCDANVLITSDFNFDNLVTNCGSNGTIEVMYTLTDTSGNFSTLTATLTIIDTTGPSLVSTIDLPNSVTCSTIPEIPELVFEDGCSTTDMTVVFNETTEFTGDEEIYDLVWTWTATDNCGNDTTITHVTNVLTENFTTPLNEERCTLDGLIDLYEYLPLDADTSIEWDVVTDDTEITDGIFDPLEVELGDYVFNYTTSNGTCLTSYELTLTINDDCIVLPCGEDDLKISKAVTPNGDNYNETFVVGGLEQCGYIIDIKIFNRFGDIVFKSADYQNDWSGQSPSGSIGSAGRLPNGTYYYVVNILDSGIDTLAGPLYLGTK